MILHTDIQYNNKNTALGITRDAKWRLGLMSIFCFGNVWALIKIKHLWLTE